jgi:hypothetical protein
MNYFYLFLGAGTAIVLLIIFYDIKNKKRVNEILRANKNIPPLFMLRSAELKVNAIRSALSTPGYIDSVETQNNLNEQLDQIMNSYKNREMPLATYYAKLGSLLITVNKMKTPDSVPQGEAQACL